MNDMSKSDATKTAVDKFLEFTDGAVASYYEACVHCGECAEACHFYLTELDPKYTPTYKLFPMVKAYKREKAPLRGIRKMLGLLPPPVTEEELVEWSPLVYDSCTMCDRCTLVCPMGIDIAGTIRKMREGYAASGLAPKALEDFIPRIRETTSPMGVTEKALRAQVAHQEKETGIKIELDKKGADYMAIFSSLEIMEFTEAIGAYAKIFKAAGVDWTISTKAYEGSNLGVQIGSSPLARDIVKLVVETAEELGVKYVIAPQCGHAYHTIRWAAPNLMGRTFNFEVIHIVELIDQLQREGRLPEANRDTRKMTLHDPCQVVRRGGLVKEPRHLMEKSCEDFVEMEYAGVTNFCCGGGGGVSANPRAAELQHKAFGLKTEQLEKIDDLEAVVMPCGNCHMVFEQGLEDYGLDEKYEIIGMAELVADTLPDEPSETSNSDKG